MGHLKWISALTMVAALSMSVAATDAVSDWRESYKVIKLGSVTVENQAATLTRFKPLAEYMEKKLGVKVEVFTASDYAGIVQALSAGHIHLGNLGGAAYAAGYIDSNGGIEPLVMSVDHDGGRGYYSVLVVRADSPYQSVDDLKGKSLAWADPNSTSGYLVPSAALREAGYNPRTHFGRTLFSGGHEQSLLGVLKGNFDAAFVSTSAGHNRGVIRIMIDRGLLKLEDIRVVWESPLIANPPWTVPKSIPADLGQAFLELFLNLANDNMALAETAARGKTRGFEPIRHEDYKTLVILAEDQRKSRRN